MLQALDLFCKAGGATKGLQRAGFHVTGVDIHLQPRYCGDAFHCADAITFPLDGFDFLWASPPCQAYSDLKNMHNAKHHPQLIDVIRDRFIATGKPWVIENVEGSPLAVHAPMLFTDISGIMLCGTMFGLNTKDWELRCHRLFESNIAMRQPFCKHSDRAVIGVYGGHLRNRQRPARRNSMPGSDFNIESGVQAMQIDWMTITELSQAIPPAYSEYIGNQVLTAIAMSTPY